MDNSDDCMCLCVFNMLHVRSEFACVIPTRTRAWQYSSPRDYDKGLVGDQQGCHFNRAAKRYKSI